MTKRCCTTYFKDPFNLTEVLFFQNWHSTFISFKKWIISKESKALKIKYRFSSKQTNYIMGFEPGTSTVLAWRVNPKTNSADGKRDSCRVGHRILLRSARNILLRSFKERSVLLKNAAFFFRIFCYFWNPKESCVLLKRMCILSKECPFFFNPEKECNILFCLLF